MERGLATYTSTSAYAMSVHTVLHEGPCLLLLTGLGVRIHENYGRGTIKLP